jgi:flagellar L-ring protein precursor FlgH
MRPRTNTVKLALLATSLGVSLSLGGCGNAIDRITRIGEEPPMKDIENPTAQANYHPVSLPMPSPTSDIRQPSRISAPPGSAIF